MYFLRVFCSCCGNFDCQKTQNYNVNKTHLQGRTHAICGAPNKYATSFVVSGFEQAANRHGLSDYTVNSIKMFIFANQKTVT